MKSVLSKLAVAVGLFIVTLLAFYLLQHGRVYNCSLGLISKNYVNHGNSNIVQEKTPYTTLSDDNLCHWDVFHYKNIRDHGYNLVNGSGIWAYAFFPLFSWIWKVTGLNAAGISILNYILFAISLILLCKTFIPKGVSQHDRLILFTLALVLPGTVVYNIPYTEGIFIFTFSLACFCLKYNLKGVFFIFFALVAVTRPAVTIILASMVGTEIYFVFTGKSYHSKPASIILRIAPILLGTFIAMYIQHQYSGQWFTFMEVQKAWGDQHFQLPGKISDWSEEGFGMSVFIILAVTLPALFYICYSFIKNFALPVRQDKPGDSETRVNEYFLVLSLFYTIGLTLFIIFFRGGSLNGLQRYVGGTPLFYIIFFSVSGKLMQLSSLQKKWLFVLLLLVGTVFFALSGYSSRFSFSDAGFYLFALCVGYLMFKNSFRGITNYVILTVLVIMLIVWKTYLLNMFLSDGWIYT